MMEILSAEELPSGFQYPASFLRVLGLGLTNIEPWHMLEGARLRERWRGLGQRFPARALIPFAIRQDNDDVACWDLAKEAGTIVVIQDFSPQGWEALAEHLDFYAWLRQAVEDLIEFE